MALCLSARSCSVLQCPGRDMAGESHQDTYEEENAVEARSRRASCEEDLPSYSSPYCAPSGVATRRLSLPTALPVLAVPLPHYDYFPGASPPRSGSGYRACPHRTHTCQGGPPCYLCSVLDVPPKYRKREPQGWHRLKEKLARLSHGPLSPPHGGRPPGHNPPPATVFTVSERRLDPTGENAAGCPASPGAAPHLSRVVEVRDNPAFDAQEPVEGGAERGPCWDAPRHPPATSGPTNTAGVSFEPHPAPLPSTLFGQVSPPPYSPSFITNDDLPSLFPQQDASAAARTFNCSRRLVCQLLYSLLLATASSTLIISYEQPILVITSVIFFLALFVFLPIITILECLFRCKMEQDFRDYLHNVITHPMLQD